MLRFIVPAVVALFAFMPISANAEINTNTSARCDRDCVGAIGRMASLPDARAPDELSVGKRGDASAGASSVVARKARQPKRELKVARNGKCPSGFNGCLAHKTSLGTTRNKASAICRRVCAGRGSKGVRSKGLKRKGAKSRGVKQARGAHASGGKKCRKGYSGCLAHKTRLGTPRNKAAAICRRVCAK